jgi:hypothetical protein
VVEKAILLLNRGADILARDDKGDTLLHIVLRCERLYENFSKKRGRNSDILWAWRLSRKSPKDLLMVFITAGADVYASNTEGETPSMVAFDYGRENEWTEALDSCSYDPEEVWAQSDPDFHHCTAKRQISKLSLEKYCQQRQEDLRCEEAEFETGDDDESDDNYDNEYSDVELDDEWIGAIADYSACGMGFGFIGSSGKWTSGIPGGNQVDDPDSVESKGLDGMDLDSNDVVNEELDIVDEFFDFGRYSDTVM